MTSPLCGTVAFGEGSETLGTGIVGYTTETLGGGKWLIAQVGFENVTGGEIDLQDLIQGIQTTTVKFDDDGWKSGAAPRIQLQARDANGVILGAGNTTYYYIKDAGLDKKGKVTAPGWADGSGSRLGAKGTDYAETPYVAAVKVKPGTAFWYQDPADSTITFAGQVLNSNTVEVFVPAGKWGLICNPFPVALSLNSTKISYEGLTGSVKFDDDGWKTGAAPRIQVQARDANGQILGAGNTTYYYIKDAGLDKKGKVTSPGWSDGSGSRLGKEGTDYAEAPYVGDVSVPVGAGFWFMEPNNDCTITFSK